MKGVKPVEQLQPETGDDDASLGPGSEKRTRFASRFLDAGARRREGVFLDDGVEGPDGPERVDDGDDDDGVNGGVGTSAGAPPWNAVDSEDVLRRVRRRAMGRSAMVRIGERGDVKGSLWLGRKERLQSRQGRKERGKRKEDRKKGKEGTQRREDAFM